MDGEVRVLNEFPHRAQAKLQQASSLVVGPSTKTPGFRHAPE
jgi:hypothetical protein